ncbi:MAG: hypothetical protein IJM85_02210 [Clostridia bacterium]|nr:hypothetical protein [Clostridia bacterium]
MKKSIRAALAATLALLIALTCVLLSLLKVNAESVEPCWTVPVGYNEHDYNKCAAFLEQTDENGVKNGEKLSENYNVNDPETWGTYWGYDDDENVAELPRFQWNYDGVELRIKKVDIYDYENTHSWQVSGSLDLSGCIALEELECYNNALTELNVTDCIALWWLNFGENSLTELDVSSNTALEYLGCWNNSLIELDVSRCTALVYLDCWNNNLTNIDISGCIVLDELLCDNNALTELNISDCIALEWLSCNGNALTELDFSNNTYLALQSLRTVGRGTIGYWYDYLGEEGAVYAYPNEDASFLGWYNASGELLSEDEEFDISETAETELIACFTVPAGAPGSGDVDGNGSVNVTDAITVLRAAMGILTISPEQGAAGDVDGSGSVNVTDAVIILRTAMGLI